MELTLRVEFGDSFPRYGINWVCENFYSLGLRGIRVKKLLKNGGKFSKK
jgi:hypothetical protein